MNVTGRRHEAHSRTTYLHHLSSLRILSLNSTMKLGMLLKGIVATACVATTLAVTVSTNPDDVEGFFSKSKSGHTNNWAVLVRIQHCNLPWYIRWAPSMD